MSHTVGGDTGGGLVLRPFRGLRYAPGRVDLGAVTSPPYDVIGAAQAKRLEAREPHNLVRLTLPDTSATAEARYARAAQLLLQWLTDGVLVRDRAPALYVYEERHSGSVHRGLLGALALRAPEERVVLPHEEVHPGPVADRLAQMRATEANLEPIYLLVPGTGAAADVVAAATATRPVATADMTATGEHASYRLWSVTDPAALATVAAALRDRQALIADGHHRYTAYRELQQHHRGAGHGEGPWDFGLAFLMDSDAHPPTLQPIHRVVAALSPTKLVTALPPDAWVGAPTSTLDEALAGMPRDRRGTHRVVVAGDHEFRSVLLPPPHCDAGATGRCPAWRGLAVTALHDVLERTLQLTDDQLTFVHDAQEAVDLAADVQGCAILLDPPDVADVHTVAAAGDRMPRKSTSFGPKPLGGLVLRTLTR